MTSVSRDLLSLHRLTVQAPGTAARLILHYGSPESALKHFDVRLTPTRPSIASAIQNRNSTEHNRWLEQDLTWLEHPDHFAISEGDAAYPSLLTEIPDPPLLLFGQGDSACLDADQLSLVGSRRASPVGISLANQFAAELAALGFVITSGLALGIDAAAHRGALTVGGLTIAVQAVGAGGVYPRRHERLAQDIAHSGCLMTEYPVGFQPRPPQFSSKKSNHYRLKSRHACGRSGGIERFCGFCEACVGAEQRGLRCTWLCVVQAQRGLSSVNPARCETSGQYCRRPRGVQRLRSEAV